MSAVEKIQAGKYTYGHQNIILRYPEHPGTRLVIGNFCSIADRCTIFLGGDHRTDWITTYPFGHIFTNIFSHHGIGHPASKGSVFIGNDVWIGSNVTIMSGIKIGDGSVVAANTHVVKDIPPYAIVGGNPGRIIKKRFTDDIIDKLLEFKWWDKSDQEIQKLVPILTSNNISELFEQ